MLLDLEDLEKEFIKFAKDHEFIHIKYFKEHLLDLGYSLFELSSGGLRDLEKINILIHLKHIPGLSRYNRTCLVFDNSYYQKESKSI